MDIFGSALISPSVSWAINRNIVTSSNRANTQIIKPVVSREKNLLQLKKNKKL